MKLREMLQEIIEKRAPYSRDLVEMAQKGFDQHSKYAQKIVEYLERLKFDLDVEL